MIALFVALGALVGAPARYLTDRAVQRGHDSRMPWGTLTVNVAASLVLGVVGGDAHLSPGAAALVGTGFCGALSTFSTFSYETVRLVDDREWFHATANVLVSLLAGLGAVSLGVAVGAAI